ncbi:nose resistant to fluoxetine protein 6-like [Branchiostoma floridae]|uniref:Nose resistant to fluoxetine protein 6-like n=1 Tax=Branchiostoma floridae TaxID=7739 RepID=A0A9J7LQC3_BRAFL|nr:nose resistant to fluoxetine protein 6-like [Branchiostoma floridae]
MNETIKFKRNAGRSLFWVPQSGEWPEKTPLPKAHIVRRTDCTRADSEMKGTAGLMLLAVLSLCGCPQTTAASVHTDDFPAIVDDFPGYFAELEKNKPINWTSTLNLLSTGQISQACYSHTYIVHNDTTLAKSYAQFMLDSTGKLTPSGVFEGNWLDIGNYKECTEDANNAVDRPEDIQAMYCLVSWAKTPEAAELNLYDSDANFRQGVCVPKSCSESEVQDLTETGFLGVKPMPSWLPVNVYCQREETYATYSTGAIVALTVIAIILCVLAVSTSYELFITIRFPEEERKPFTTSRVGRFCLSCSVYSNTKKVFNTYQHPGQLPALHGIRVISALWIIYGHVYGFPPIDTANKVEKTEDGKQWWFLIIRGNYDMAVDTFLLLSGLLVTYLFMKQMKKTGGQFTWRDYGLHVLHRYFRLTPVLALLIMIFTCLIAYMGSGPWWAIRDNFTMDFVQNCEKYWWANLLYINNFVGQRCFTHGWYLGADMQLYVTLTGLLVVLYRYPKVGVAVACFLIGSSWLLNGILYHFLVNVNGESYSYTTYRWSFTRMAPYLIGILLGYLLFRTNRKVPDTPNTRGLMLLGWIVGTTCALVAFFTPFGAPEANLLGHPAWKAFERSLFAAGVAWVVYACCVGYGGIITEFLSWSGWLPLSRLTYTAYIIHPMIIQAYYMAYRGPRLYSSLTWWFMFVSFSFMSLLCGFAASMMAEAPFLELEKILLPNRRGREAKPETTAEDGHDSMAMKAVECDPDPPLPPHDGKGTSGPNGC